MSLLSRTSRLPRVARGLLLALSTMAVVVACGDDGEKQDSASTTSSNSTTTAAGGSSGSGGNQSSTSSNSTDATTASGSGGMGSTTSSSTGMGASGGGSVLVGDLSDSFDGDGQLIDYVTNNPNSLPDVMRAGGRYRANLVNNANNITLHYHQDQGRLDAKLVAFPFEVVVRNIGIGTQANSQTAPAPNGFLYVFAGVQVHVQDLNARDSSHVVVGHRGDQYFTVEGKNTVNGNSSVNDAGGYIVPDGRADIRIVGNPDHTLTVYWQTPNPAPGSQSDSWTLYNGTGTLPGQAPNYGNNVYVGLITYAYGNNGVPFVGTADSVEGGTIE